MYLECTVTFRQYGEVFTVEWCNGVGVPQAPTTLNQFARSCPSEC